MANEHSVATDLDSILNGSFQYDDESNEDENEEYETEEDDYIEDTDANSEEEEDEDTNDQDADSDDDTSAETDEDSSGEYSQEDANNNSKDDESEDKDSKDGLEDKSKDNSGTDSEEKDKADENTDSKVDSSDSEKEIDYKAFYEKVTNTEFKANGKLVKGFVDPDKIIQAQQMLYGFDEKMAGFKKYRPVYSALDKCGMIENPGKFNLMMDIMNGDKEAIKHLLKSQNIDPVIDLDLDEITYVGNNYVDSQKSLDVEDTIKIARNLGIEDKFRQTVGKEWDAESFDEFTSKSAVREDLLNHMSTKIDPNNPDSETIYDAVQNKISEMKLLDTRGTFNSKNSVNQYREAIAVLANERKAAYDIEMARQQKVVSPKVTQTGSNNGTISTATIEAEKAKIIAKREADDYSQKVKDREKEVAEKRNKASSVSKNKPKVASKEPKFDPLKLNGKDFFDAFERIGRS